MAIETVADAVDVTKILYKGRATYLHSVLQWWSAQLGPDRLLKDITPDDIDAGVKVLIESPALQFKKNTGVVEAKKQRSPATINRYVGALGTMFKLLRQNRRLPLSFVSPVVRGLKLPESPGRTLVVSLDDVKRLVAASRLSNNRKLAALVAVACTTGLRKGSLQALTWDQIDLKARVIDVARTKNGLPIRSVLPSWVVGELVRIRPDSPSGLPVFGKHDFKRAFASALDRAGLPEAWCFHLCRHMSASILAQSGASLIEIMSVLNHKSPSMALRYSHLNTKSIEAAVSRAWG